MLPAQHGGGMLKSVDQAEGFVWHMSTGSNSLSCFVLGFARGKVVTYQLH